MVNEFGAWWDYNGIYLEQAFSGGFTEEQAEIIGPQVQKSASESRQYGKPQYSKVRLDDKEFYVFITFNGDVEIPRDKNRVPIKTLDTSLIHNIERD